MSAGCRFQSESDTAIYGEAIPQLAGVGDNREAICATLLRPAMKRLLPLLRPCSRTVDLVNEIGALAEDRDPVLSRIREKAKEMDPKKLSRAVFSLRQVFHAEKISEDVATWGRRWDLAFGGAVYRS